MALDDALLPVQRDDPRRIGPYRVVARLGAGGMGIVYAAMRSRDQAAVKLIRPEYAADAQFRERFRREVALLSRVEGACVARFLSADTETARPWLATSYVPGPTLNAYVGRHGPLRGDALLSVAIGVAEALAVIHRAGVIHRDLKPSNVILSPDGPKVLDFGIARALDESAITVTHVFVGSSGWASPEQYQGHEVGPANDVYGWGAVVAYAATGHAPLGTGSVEVMAHRILTEKPELGEVPESLRGLVSSGLAKDPVDRPTVEELVETLAELAEVHADDATQVATRILSTGWESVAAVLSVPSPWSGTRRFSRTAVVGGVAAAAVLVSGAATLVALDGTGEKAKSPAASARPLAGPTPPDVLTKPATPRSSPLTDAASPPAFTPPGSWAPTDLSGITFSTAGDWTNGFPDSLPSDTPEFLCLLPPGVTPAGMSACRGDALTFTIGAKRLDTDADWRQRIGEATGFAFGTDHPVPVPGHFTHIGTAFVGDHKAGYREFMLTTPDGVFSKLRAWWLPVTKLWIFSTVDTRYDTVVDHMLATFDFTGFHQPAQ